jgi:ABC-type uncharacterized transport system auxiliary subunit
MVCASGCALLRKSEPLQVRYFSASTPASKGASSEASGTPLRLGKVAAASHLGERMVYRKDAVEVGYYEGLRWTEPPEHYLQRMLATQLFERGRFARVVSGPGPTLEATLLTFEEQQGSPRVARASVAVSLYDDRMSRLEQTFEVDIDLSDDGEPASQLANALTKALQHVVTQIVARTEQTLADANSAAAPQAASR